MSKTESSKQLKFKKLEKRSQQNKTEKEVDRRQSRGFQKEAVIQSAVWSWIEASLRKGSDRPAFKP